MMKYRQVAWVLAVLCVAGCKRSAGPASAPARVDAAPAPPPLQPIGVLDPTPRLPSAQSRALSHAYQALRAKRWDEARRGFEQVAAAVPDELQARYGLVRALALSGDFAEVPAAWEALLARDFVGYAGRLARGKDFAALRASPAWARVGELEARYRAAWTSGLQGGFFLVARTRPAVEPSFPDGTTEAPLDLKQEVFHYDPASKRFARLTATGGHAFALLAFGHTLAYLAIDRLHREHGADSFVDPKVGTVDLTTLATVGPMVMKGPFDQVVLGDNAAGMPLFTFVAADKSATYTFDTAHTALAPLSGDAILPHGGETRAWPGQVVHLDEAQVPGVHVTDGASQLTLDGIAQPIVAARPIAKSSVGWSPRKTRLTYAGKLDACAALAAESHHGAVPDGGVAQAPPKNELYVYDVATRTAQRVAAGISAFQTFWLDDDHLVYEAGVGKDGRLHVYDFAAHADQALPPRHGAGLFGVPTLACERAEGGVDQDLGPPQEGEDD